MCLDGEENVETVERDTLFNGKGDVLREMGDTWTKGHALRRGEHLGGEEKDISVQEEGV